MLGVAAAGDLAVDAVGIIFVCGVAAVTVASAEYIGITIAITLERRHELTTPFDRE